MSLNEIVIVHGLVGFFCSTVDRQLAVMPRFSMSLPRWIFRFRSTVLLPSSALAAMADSETATSHRQRLGPEDYEEVLSLTGSCQPAIFACIGKPYCQLYLWWSFFRRLLPELDACCLVRLLAGQDTPALYRDQFINFPGRNCNEHGQNVEPGYATLTGRI